MVTAFNASWIVMRCSGPATRPLTVIRPAPHPAMASGSDGHIGRSEWYDSGMPASTTEADRPITSARSGPSPISPNLSAKPIT